MPADWSIDQFPDFLSPSAASDCLAPVPPFGLSDQARSGPGTRAGPTRAGPRRDKPGHGVTVATPEGDVTRGRDHRPPALPPGPLPKLTQSCFTLRSPQVC